MDVNFIRSTDGGQTWSAPKRVNDDPTGTTAWQWFGTMSVAPNGRIDVIWNDTRNSLSNNRLSEVFYSYSYDGGATFSKNIKLTPQWDSHLGWPNQNKIGDYYHMISENSSAALAYAATFNGEQDVYFLRLGDCNNNLKHDGIDIANGTSLDDNQNLIPDECE
jgi:Neuraminidase (sialidase)